MHADGNRGNCEDAGTALRAGTASTRKLNLRCGNCEYEVTAVDTAGTAPAVRELPVGGNYTFGVGPAAALRERISAPTGRPILSPGCQAWESTMPNNILEPCKGDINPAVPSPNGKLQRIRISRLLPVPFPPVHPPTALFLKIFLTIFATI